MKVNFLMSQANFLPVQSLDIDIRQGVCSAMVFEWLKRELDGLPQHFLYYKNNYLFASRQRAMNQRILRENTYTLILKSDRIAYNHLTSFHYSHFANAMHHIKSAVFIIDLFQSFDVSHSIGLSISNGKHKLFDPNFGEYEARNIKNEKQALTEFQQHIHRYYAPINMVDMRIIQLQKM